MKSLFLRGSLKHPFPPIFISSQTLGLDSKDSLSRVLDFILLFHWYLGEGSYRLPHPPWDFPQSPLKLPPPAINRPHSSPLPFASQLQTPALSFPDAMSLVQIMTSPVPPPPQQKGTPGEKTRMDMFLFFTGSNVLIPLLSLLGPLLLLRLKKKKME